MKAESQVRTAPSISGHMIDLGVGRSIAIYERNGVHWVAEFRDGCGELTCADAWFRLYAGDLRHWHVRRAAVRPARPLTLEMLESIERLHRESEAREERSLAVPRSVAAAAQRCWTSVMSRLHGGVSRTSQPLG
jgi:hypothetical protein